MLISGVTLTGTYVVDVPSIVTANLSMNLDAATYTSGLTWADSSGNGKNANIAGATTTYTTNGFNIIRFNGNAYANAYLGFGTTLNTSAGYTFDVWAQPAAGDTSYTLVGEWNNDTVNSSWTDAQMGFLSNNRIAAGYYNGAVAIAPTVTTSGTWYHIVFTYNGVNNGNLYINGTRVATTAYITKSNPGGSVFLSLGKLDGAGGYLGGVTNNFTGNIGAWKVYSKKFTDAEVLQNYRAMAYRYSDIPSIVTTNLSMFLDAGNPSSYTGTGTAWTDLSGNSRNGTLINGPTYSSADGGSIVFDGTNDYVQCTGSITATAATFVSWIRRNGTQGTYDCILFSRGSSVTGMMFQSSNQLAYTWNNAVNAYTWQSGLTVPDLTWCMVAVSVTGTSATAYLCQSSGITSATNTVTHTSTTLDDIKIGQDDFGGRFFNGNIATAMIYNRALSANEILQNYRAQAYRYGLQ